VASHADAQPVPGPSRAIDNIDVEVTFPEGPFYVADTVPIEFEMALPPSFRFDSIDIRDAGHLSVVDRNGEETERPDGGTDVHFTLSLKTMRPGNHRVGHFNMTLQGSDGIVRDRDLPGGEVRITSLTANSNNPELKDERGGLAVIYRDYTLAWVGAIGGGALLMAFMGFLIARRPKEYEPPPPPPPRPAHEIALEKLDALREAQLLEKGLFMEYYVGLSGAIREYLGNRYGFDGLDSTTEEITQLMAGIELPAVLGPEFLAHMLYECDLVKFAKYAPSSTDQNEALRQAYRLVEETKLVVVASEVGQADSAPPVVAEETPASPQTEAVEAKEGPESAREDAPEGEVSPAADSDKDTSSDVDASNESKPDSGGGTT